MPYSITSMSDETYAETQGANIIINGFVYRDRNILEKDYQERVNERFFTQGSTYRDIATHESAHVIVYMNQLKTKDMYVRVFGKPKESAVNVIIENVSEYALKDPDELIAEAYVSYRNGFENDYVLNTLEYSGMI